MNLYAYSPATDTQEIRSDLRGPFFERETVELHLLDLRPTVTRYTRPSRLARLRHSAFMEDVRSRLHIIPEAIGALAVVGAGVFILRGLAVAATLAGVR